jgi:hypothetical protein
MVSGRSTPGSAGTPTRSKRSPTAASAKHSPRAQARRQRASQSSLTSQTVGSKASSAMRDAALSSRRHGNRCRFGRAGHGRRLHLVGARRRSKLPSTSERRSASACRRAARSRPLVRRVRRDRSQRPRSNDLVADLGPVIAPSGRIPTHASGAAFLYCVRGSRLSNSQSARRRPTTRAAKSGAGLASRRVAGRPLAGPSLGTDIRESVSPRPVVKAITAFGGVQVDRSSLGKDVA